MTALSDFDYTLPEVLIADQPRKDRVSARMLHVAKESLEITHKTFSDIENHLGAGDVLVLNNTKVMPARLLGKRETGGVVEVLLVENQGAGEWEALTRPSGKIRKGDRLTFEKDDQSLEVEILDDAREGTGKRRVRILEENYYEILNHVGHVPLPPYIRREDRPEDKELYQTVFAEKLGAVAAPTAGLHFNDVLLDQLRAKGVDIVYVTLHVSYGSFQPIQVEELETHEMFKEYFEVSQASADMINRAKREGRRVIACGTTSVRTLESAVNEDGKVLAQEGQTQLFIYPPFPFKIVDGLITNFHLPKSSLMLLVAAFMGSREALLASYEEAIREKYKFYSYGDAMLIL